HRLRFALAACALQVAIFASPFSAGLARWALPIHVASLALVGLVMLANRRSPGVALLIVGLLLNALVLSFNTGFMPVSSAALTLTRTSDALLIAPGVRQQ